mmetsp:Transcript_24682/g.68684  ORF Transcript_24682/g.68684 Transcript_24682/m.68684 type:complete len:88 (-) Transcript_24682:74-337(-)
MPSVAAAVNKRMRADLGMVSRQGRAALILNRVRYVGMTTQQLRHLFKNGMQRDGTDMGDSTDPSNSFMRSAAFTTAILCTTHLCSQG